MRFGRSVTGEFQRNAAAALAVTLVGARRLCRMLRLAGSSLADTLHGVSSLAARFRPLVATMPALALGACGGAGSPDAQPSSQPSVTCAPGSYPSGTSCHVFATITTVRAPTPFTEAGRPVELAIVLYAPPSSDRLPTVVFNHGSTGDGSDPSLFGDVFTSETVARFFAEKGWQVAFVQRRGRGGSDGLYDEGFTADRSGYSCETPVALAGVERALADLDAAVDYLRSRADVDTTRMLVAGTSRGGILSIVHIARRPDVYRGAINFVGGWLGEGCGDYASVNRSLFEQGAAFPGPSLWLYAANDSFYSLTHSGANFDAFTAAGGLATMKTYTRAAGKNGHFLLNDPDLWSADLADYVVQVAP